ncbi:hypothetical protein B9Z19DRAFT_1131806 [Tuber borchii]|uniref:Uncharacterized protein n=1 Tax=Tuber borchii TaxID=42251 RepID=A0A2T6ZI77_TUBBO|nr:hypothetical protein B9Z19DRAFT_1131806 [Tuber borchii]
MSLFDTLHLLYQIYHRYRNTGDGNGRIRRIHIATRGVVEMRLHRHRTEEQDDAGSPQGGPQTATLLCRFERCAYNTPIRHQFSAVLILQYVKLCGYHGIPVSFSLATGYFASWIIMEVILLIGEGRTAMEPSRAALPEIEPPAVAGRGVFFAQSIAILVSVSILLLRAQNEFKFVHGETVPSFDLRFAVFLIISFSLMYWVDSMPLFVGISLMSGFYVSGHKNSRKVSDRIGLFMAITYIFIITTVFYSSWIVGAAHLPFVSYITYFYASPLFCRGEEGTERRKGCRGMARLEPVLIFGSSALTYAGGLLFFYVFVFKPEGTWMAGWTESFP